MGEHEGRDTSLSRDGTTFGTYDIPRGLDQQWSIVAYMGSNIRGEGKRIDRRICLGQ